MTEVFKKFNKNNVLKGISMSDRIVELRELAEDTLTNVRYDIKCDCPSCSDGHKLKYVADKAEKCAMDIHGLLGMVQKSDECGQRWKTHWSLCTKIIKELKVELRSRSERLFALKENNKDLNDKLQADALPRRGIHNPPNIGNFIRGDKIFHNGSVRVVKEVTDDSIKFIVPCPKCLMHQVCDCPKIPIDRLAELREKWKPYGEAANVAYRTRGEIMVSGSGPYVDHKHYQRAFDDINELINAVGEKNYLLSITMDTRGRLETQLADLKDKLMEKKEQEPLKNRLKKAEEKIEKQRSIICDLERKIRSILRTKSGGQ